MSMRKQDIKSMDLQELTAFVESLGEKPYRAKQLFSWMHQKLAPSIDEMTSLSISGTRPQVETVMLLWLICRPFSSLKSRIKRIRLS